MSKLDRESEIVRLASELGLSPGAAPVAAIVAHCERKVRGWLRGQTPAPQTLAELEALVCERLRLVFEEVWTDEDLNRIITKYVGMKEFVFVQLRDDLDTETFATLLERKHVTASSPDRYVAVIDCRGEKAARRYFTRWHEIAHLMTMTRQLELPFHRSRLDRNPTEQLMDVIAGEIGFYGPMFSPTVHAEVSRAGRLTFQAVDAIRNTACAGASFRATLNASVARLAGPALLVEAGMGLKARERAAVESRQMMLIPVAPPKPKLRVLTVMSNEGARDCGFRVDRNMQVPPESMIYRHFNTDDVLAASADQEQVETLEDWRHSDGTCLGDARVIVQTRRVGDRILGLMQPAPHS